MANGFWDRVDFLQSEAGLRRHNAVAFNSRRFDGCLESYDGDLIVTAIVRRAAYLPEIKANFIDYLGADGWAEWEQAAYRWRHIREDQFAKTSREIQRAEQAAAERRSAEWMAQEAARA